MTATMKRAAIVTAMTVAALAVLVALGFATGVIRTYSAPMNAGVTVGAGCTGAGFEYRGNVGFFTDLCQ